MSEEAEGRERKRERTRKKSGARERDLAGAIVGSLRIAVSPSVPKVRVKTQGGSGAPHLS